jgi:peptidyl-prolyl cis-trans isomerase A (cyclophilin A)
MKKIIFLLAFFCCMSVSTQAQNTTIKIDTEVGVILAELYTDKASVTCKNFIRYIQEQAFNGASFYRVVRMNNQPRNNVKIEVIQGGLGFNNSATRFEPIIHETTKETGILHENGTLSMARVEPGTASSEFFICIGNQPALDFGGKRNPDGQGFAAFGKVTKGMEVVKKIQSMKDKSQMLTEKVLINAITIIN